MNTMLRKSVLGVAGLAFAGGVFAGPVAAHAVPSVEGGPVAVAVRADKASPDMGKLVPHGVQGAQSRVELS
ncbi:hypothetical protein V6V16_12635, partial [Micromonospora sp. CPCC 205561]